VEARDTLAAARQQGLNAISEAESRELRQKAAAKDQSRTKKRSAPAKKTPPRE
jgi:hypothetical protein